MRAHPEKAREARQCYRQRRAARCQPLCIVLSKDPRIEAAAQKRKAKTRQLPAPRQAPAPKRSREAALAAGRQYYQDHRETLLARQRVERRADPYRTTRHAYARKNAIHAASVYRNNRSHFVSFRSEEFASPKLKPTSPVFCFHLHLEPQLLSSLR